MAYTAHPTEPSRADIDALQGAAVLEFGTSWCGFCRAAQPLIKAELSQSPVQHIKVEDGKGEPLGRSFQVKLWPTLIFLKDGRELARVVRPSNRSQIRGGLDQITGNSPDHSGSLRTG
ncbi:MAG: thioredoxin family protein [Povalibacter sp.]